MKQEDSFLQVSVKRRQLSPATAPPESKDLAANEVVRGGAASSQPCWCPIAIGAVQRNQGAPPESCMLLRPDGQKWVAASAAWDAARQPFQPRCEEEVLYEHVLHWSMCWLPPGLRRTNADNAEDACVALPLAGGEDSNVVPTYCAGLFRAQ